jgi:hypothetical protein
MPQRAAGPILNYMTAHAAPATLPRTLRLWSVPTFATLNPIGAPIVHAGLHIVDVLHSYEKGVFLPPHSSTTRNEGGTP